MQQNLIDGHDPAQVHLDPPVAEGIVAVRFPVGVRITIEDVFRCLRIGAYPADTRPGEVGIERVVFFVGDDVALYVEREGAVDIEDGVLVFLAPEIVQGAGKGVLVVEDIVALARAVGSNPSFR